MYSHFQHGYLSAAGLSNIVLLFQSQEPQLTWSPSLQLLPLLKTCRKCGVKACRAVNWRAFSPLWETPSLQTVCTSSPPACQGRLGCGKGGFAFRCHAGAACGLPTERGGICPLPAGWQSFRALGCCPCGPQQTLHRARSQRALCCFRIRRDPSKQD